MEHFIKQTSDDKYIENVLNDKISQLEKSIEPEERKKEYEEFCKKYNADLSDEKAEKLFESLHNIELRKEKIVELKNIKGFTEDRETLSEVYDLIDKLLKILLYCPDKIPDLKLSDKVVQKIKSSIDKRYDGYGVVYTILGMISENCSSKFIKYEPFMITLDESTDRVISMLENFVFDGGNCYYSIEKFCTYISSTPVNIVGMKEFCIGENFPKSKNLPNPYRGKYGVY